MKIIFIAVFAAAAAAVIIKLRKSKHRDIRFADIVFALCIISFCYAAFILTDTVSEKSDRENRMLAAFPDRSPFHEKFPKETDAYINDRIGFRDISLKIYGYLIKSGLIPAGTAINQNGKYIDGLRDWIFDNSIGNGIKYYTGQAGYKEDNLKSFADMVNETQGFCKENGISFIILIVPNKATVYGENYSPYLVDIDDNGGGKIRNINNSPVSNYDILINYLKDNTDTRIINLKDVLENAKDECLLYYKQDTHWTSCGAFFAYAAMEKPAGEKFDKFYFDKQKMKSRILNDPAHNLADVKGVRHSLYDFKDIYFDDNMTGINHLGLYNNLKGGNNNGIGIFILHDSFIGAMYPYIWQSTEKISARWRYYRTPLYYKEDILELKPDILLWEIQERFILGLTDDKMQDDYIIGLNVKADNSIK